MASQAFLYAEYEPRYANSRPMPTVYRVSINAKAQAAFSAMGECFYTKESLKQIFDVRWTMAKRFKVGDHVKWNSEAGYVSGHITRVHTRDTTYKGHNRHASDDEPQYEIQSDKTNHLAMHKDSALTKIDQ